MQLVFSIALLALAGQGAVFLLTRMFGQDPGGNFFFRLLGVVASPFVKLLRKVSPQFVRDRHLPFAAFGLLLIGWIWVTVEIANVCVGQGIAIRECLRST